MQFPPPQSLNTPPTDRQGQLRQASKELEVVFLSEMLKSAGFGKPPEEFGGGAGEDQFSSFLVTQQAKAFAEQGGIGLAEHIFRTLEARNHE